MARKRGSESDAFVILLVLAALAAVVSMGAALLYIPLRKYSGRNPGKGLGILGIAFTIVGLAVLVYQVGSSGEAGPQGLSATSWAGWLPFAIGIVLYLCGLITGSGYHAQVLAASGEIEKLAEQEEGITEERLREAARQICQRRALPPSEVQAAVSEAGRALVLRVIESGGKPPITAPPEGVFLKAGEQCHVCFTSVVLCEDVLGTERSTVGGAVYWRVADGVTLRPSAYSGKSMPVSELRQVDLGCLLITSNRVIFQGQKYRRDTSVSKIEGISQYGNGFQIQTTGKSKREVFSVSPAEMRLATALISRLVIAQLHANRTSLAEQTPSSPSNRS